MSHKAVAEIALNESESRYEAYVGGELAGFAEYEIDDERIVFTHTEVADAFEGQGVAGQLARTALDDVRASGKYRVVPRCPYIKKWIDKHPDYQDLVHPH
ncbi:hypothetical protein FB382_001459 [Nocardioides ginsengisegetis]|uniref:N-acetyltransferase domain-containing protein n=1 Tax=Nocardioides ginsengisegetis TaxID=661491 RepID=A0A7W3IYT3_9ACTN|nr:GNAT family N-acetyltransferase [Nocardioides ginsengisegetis]MBA8803168.1 hypothetical protein [Nocardioides ginsengisegetis]